MEFRINTEHRVVISDSGLAIITRLPINGGVPKSISIQLDDAVTLRDAMTKLIRIAHLDTEMFNMIWESQQDTE